MTIVELKPIEIKVTYEEIIADLLYPGGERGK
jgi:hypothetical protein